ncbi:competence type IV pilus minor pilin ComGE [Enterococcus xiangfangensis]|uniref:Competence type IV pilus minor pilin ComGE n=1 Tax=Enterococcus xiangfangensis TaxID=1296537 RepID=A0ABU3FAU6_9ENTE|nr:competence type IV pilus minor pilin ComGE [Enterococcus xiangfangensis]MDT2759793.1 competence type IV pilus minor pilin ComGE [Enterococcus xiangfangensis]
MVALKGNKGYILLESLISLTILLILVASYVGVTAKMQSASQERLALLTNYRDLYTEVRRCRLHSVSSMKPQIEISLEQGKAVNHQGGIVVAKK